MDHQVITQALYNESQSWYYRETRRYYIAGTGHKTLRANICRNAYDHQSYAKIEQWSDLYGWLLIELYPITHFPASVCSYVIKTLSEDQEEAMAYTAEQMFTIGERFITSEENS